MCDKSACSVPPYSSQAITSYTSSPSQPQLPFPDKNSKHC